MKRNVQSPGVRKWFGDDWITLQNELYSVLEGFFGAYNQQFVISGCAINGNDISAGIIGLIDGNGFHVCTFAGVQGTTWPVYFHPEKIIENREYLDLQAKPVFETWTAVITDNDPGGYFEFKQDGSSKVFTDIIQTTQKRFVTDAEKASYASQEANAIAALRDGVAAEYDTLAKLVVALASLGDAKQDQDDDLTAIATLAENEGFLKKTAENTWVLDNSNLLTEITKAMVEAVLTGTINSHNHQGTYEPVFNKNDAFNKNFGTEAGTICQGNDQRLSDNRTPSDSSVVLSKLGNELKAVVDLGSGTDINFQAGVDFERVMGANLTFTFSNLVKGKVVVLWLSGNYSPAWPAFCVPEKGSEEYDGTVENKVVLHCRESAVGSEKVFRYITQEDS